MKQAPSTQRPVQPHHVAEQHGSSIIPGLYRNYQTFLKCDQNHSFPKLLIVSYKVSALWLTMIKIRPSSMTNSINSEALLLPWWQFMRKAFTLRLPASHPKIFMGLTYHTVSALRVLTPPSLSDWDALSRLPT